MWSIYLLLILTRLTKLLITIGTIAAAIWAVAMLFQLPAYFESWSVKSVNTLKRVRNIALTISILFLMFGILIPNSKEAAIIFSVGNTIEYVQNNEKIKELPDKAVLCLDKFISEYLEENEK